MVSEAGAFSVDAGLRIPFSKRGQVIRHALRITVDRFPKPGWFEEAAKV